MPGAIGALPGGMVLRDLAGAPCCFHGEPGRPTDKSRLVILQHPGPGAQVPAEIHARQGSDALLDISEQIAACHPERWDGTGYAAGLAGVELPLPARIASIAFMYVARSGPGSKGRRWYLRKRSACSRKGRARNSNQTW